MTSFRKRIGVTCLRSGVLGSYSHSPAVECAETSISNSARAVGSPSVLKHCSTRPLLPIVRSIMPTRLQAHMGGCRGLPSPTSHAASSFRGRMIRNLSTSSYPMLPIHLPLTQRWECGNAPVSVHGGLSLLSTTQSRGVATNGSSADGVPVVERAESEEVCFQDGIALSPSMGIKDAVSLCCERLGRPCDDAVQEMICNLSSNWYSTLENVHDISSAEAKSMDIPLRLITELKALRDEALAMEDLRLAGEKAAKNAAWVKGAGAPAGALSLRTKKPGATFNGSTVTGKTRKGRYALTESETSGELQREISSFYRFCTQKSFNRQTPQIAKCTADKYIDILRRMLGWMVRVREVPPDQVSLLSLVPSAQRGGAEVAFDYLIWLEQERGLSKRTLSLNAICVLVLAQYLYHGESGSIPEEGDKPYSDIPVVRELRRLTSQYRASQKGAGPVADESMKWLDWPQYLEVVDRLRTEFEEAAARDEASPKDVAWKLQTYLMFAVLACVPDRQRTLRELEEGRTLIKDNLSGAWQIRHGPEDYKTGAAYGDRPILQLAPWLFPVLETWLKEYRQHLDPQHELVFSQLNGKPFSDDRVHNLFARTCFRLTGQKTNPHLIRDSIVTFLKSGDATEKELEALAIYMGHSPNMQRTVYDRRTKEQKVTPAVDLLLRLQGRRLGDAYTPS